MNRSINIIIILLSLCRFSYSQLNPGQVGNDQAVCYGSAPVALVFTAQPEGGTAPYMLRWQRSNDGGATWNDITGVSGSRTTYSPPVLGRTAMFRCRVSDSSQSPLSGVTNHVTIIVASDLSAGTIGSAQIVYAGTAPATLEETTPPSGGGGYYTYQWQSSPDGLYWSNINGANLPSYSSPSIIRDRWYRRFLKDELCGSVASNLVKISVTPITLFTTEVPVVEYTYGMRLALGTEYEVLTDGYIRAVRLFCTQNDVGLHQIRIFRQNLSGVFELIAGPFEWRIYAGFTGWQEYELANPLVFNSGQHGIVSITTVIDEESEFFFVRSPDFAPLISNDFVRYIRGGVTSNLSIPPRDESTTATFRDIVFVPFSAGVAGLSQAICRGVAPAPLSQISPPTGGPGNYSFQWQSSFDGSSWANIPGAAFSEYAPPSLLTTTFFRRAVTSDGITQYTAPVEIHVSSPIGAQINSSMSIYENSSAFISINISNGDPPYRIEYSVNGIPQPVILDYINGTDLYTGILAEGSYIYELISVSDASGCATLDLGSPITITSQGSYQGSETRNGILLVNSSSAYYNDFLTYLQPYLDWFGVPYTLHDVVTNPSLPDLSNYSIIILGHRDIDAGIFEYPVTEIEAALQGGTGLYSFDPGLFNVPSNLVETEIIPPVTSSAININPLHYITEYHQPDIYHLTNNHIIPLRDFGGQQIIRLPSSNFSIRERTILATMTDTASITAPLLSVASYGAGRIVSWSSYEWVFDEKLGPLIIDDLLWRGIVWAAKKPFVMQGIPPMITMRVDDVDGTRSELIDLEWLRICNESGFIPWCGTFIDYTSEDFYEILRGLINNNLATASPHSFGYDEFIFYNQNNEPDFDAAANVRRARAVYEENEIPISNFMVPHWYLLDSLALEELWDMGVEFIGTKIPYNPVPYPGFWLNVKPYRINRGGWGGTGVTYFNGGYVNWLGYPFFICLTEIADDGGYEWYPTSNSVSTTARGVRHLRRALNNMVLATLFTHEDQIVMPAEIWRTIVNGISQGIEPYSPEYRSMDYAVQYIRAKENLGIVTVVNDTDIIAITCLGSNDMETRCYLFTENDGVISHRFISIPVVNSDSVPVTICVMK